ncbi:MAG: hypothetical protein U0T79_09205 [Ferruginibacter sp.]
MSNQDSKPLPAFYIGGELTETRKGNFISQKHGLLSTALNRDDTKSIWYTRDHIAGLLDEIDLAGGDGLRIYFGAYESGHEYEGQLCLVMNVTREKIVNDITCHQNVVLENEPDFNDRLSADRDSGIGSNKLGGNRDYNFGSPCPPRCD